MAIDISASKLAHFVLCGESFRRRYIENEKRPYSFAASRGTAVHKAVEENFKQKIESREDIPVRDFVDLAVTEYDERMRSGEIERAGKERQVDRGVLTGRTRDAVADLATFHIRKQAPEYLPLVVEEWFEIQLPGRKLRGRLDLGTRNYSVVDFKTRATSPHSDEAHRSIQLTTSAAGFRAITGSPAVSVALDVTVNRASDVKRVKLNSERTAADFEALAERLDTVDRSIDAGIFLPADPHSWYCKSGQCPYFEECKYVNPSRSD